MIKYIRAKPEQYNIELNQLQPFEHLLIYLDQYILSGNIFYNFIHAKNNHVPLITNNLILKAEIKQIINYLYQQITTNIDLYAQINIVELYTLYALYRNLFNFGDNNKQVDHKLYHKLWSLQLDFPLVVLYANSIFMIANFLASYASLSIKKLKPDIKKVYLMRENYVDKMDETFALTINALYIQTAMWMVRIESELVSNNIYTLSAILNARSKLILNGLLLAKQIKNHLITCLYLHKTLNKPFNSKNLNYVSKALELLKAIQLIYQTRLTTMLGENISKLILLTKSTLYQIYSKKYQEILKLKKNSLEKLHSLACVGLIVELLNPACIVSTNCLTVLKLLSNLIHIKNNNLNNCISNLEIRYFM